MQQRKFNSHALRQLAEEILHAIAEAEEIPESEQEDLATSLVRQWITYDGRATLFVGEHQVYLVLGTTPLGKPSLVAEPSLPGWMNRLREDWKIRPDDLPEVINQLNRGQSAEVVNSDGVPLRVWVNPKERSRGVEPLVKQDPRPGRKRDYGKIATSTLERQFGDGLDREERDELACSLAKQWQRHEGHACLFIDSHQQLHFKLTEHGDGTCDVVARILSVDLESALCSSLGFPPEALADLIVQINLGQEVEFCDKQGAPSVLWHDPKARRICSRKVGPAQSTMPVKLPPPILCPACTAVLKPWWEGERQQTCPLCGQTISLC
jgi:hypothetical protein